MRRAAWWTTAASCSALVGCLELEAVQSPDGGSGGVVATGGSTASGGGSPGSGGAGGAAAAGGMGATAGTGATSGAGGSGATGADAGDGAVSKTPFVESELSVQHSGDSAPNASGTSMFANIPGSTRFMIACRHARDNDTSFGFSGSMTVGGQFMTAIDQAARGVNGNNQAGVHCFQLADPPTGAQTVQFTVSGMGTYDFLRITAVYFARPASIHAHSIATHASGNTHGQSIVTSEPAVVLAIYTKYFTDLVSGAGFNTLVSQAGFGNEAMAYVGALVQTQASTVPWSVNWGGQSSFGGSQLVAVVPK